MNPYERWSERLDIEEQTSDWHKSQRDEYRDACNEEI